MRNEKHRMWKMILILAMATTSAAYSEAQTPAPRVVDLKAQDGTRIKATYFAAAGPGPGVVLIHQSNRTRKSWDDLAALLAAAGINVLTIDLRGFGESGTPERSKNRLGWPEDVDAALGYLAGQPGVNHNAIGLGGAGWLGVLNCVDAARRHPAAIKSLVLLSGETGRDGLQFLHQASRLPEMFIFSDDDEYPPTQDAMKLLYVAASSPSKKLVHYSAPEDAPWLWYEDSSGKVPAHGAHGTDLFQAHAELPDLVVHWFVTTLTNGQAPPDALAAAEVLNRLQFSAEISQVASQLTELRRKDPTAQLWPEVAVDIIGSDYERAGDIKTAIEVFKLNLLAYPNSADSLTNLADAYLMDGQKVLAREYAEKALAILDAHTFPLSSWSDTEQRRGEIRHDAQQTLEKLRAAHQ